MHQPKPDSVFAVPGGESTSFEDVPIEASGAIVVQLDGSGRVLRANEAARQLPTLTTMVAARPFGEAFVPPGHRAEIEEALARVMAEPATVRVETIVGPPGSRRIHADLAITSSFEGGGCRHILVVGLDVTARRQAERELAVANHQLQSIFDSLDEVFWSFDLRAGRLVRVSEGSHSIFGMAPAEALDAAGSNWRSLVHPDDRGAADAILLLLSRGRAVSEQIRVLRPDGLVRWVEANIKPTLEEDGTLTRVDGILTDVTDRKQAEQEMRRSQQRQALLLRSLPMALYTLSRSPPHELSWISEHVDRVAGFGPAAFRETPGFWASRLHPDDRERALRSFRDLDIDGSQTLEYRWRCADGTFRWFHDQRVIVRDDHGAAREILGSWRDVTERHVTADALNRTNEELRIRVEELEHVTRVGGILNELAELLQACISVDEAYRVISDAVQQLLPGLPGVLFALPNDRRVAEPVARWGAAGPRVTFAAGDCVGLRRGRPHVVQDSRTGLLCRHVPEPRPPAYLCVPLVAQGTALALLHVQGPAPGTATRRLQRSAIAIAEHCSLTLANLELRDSLRALSIRDPLTGLFNRRHMEQAFATELRRCHRSSVPLAVVMLDIDRFKDFNDLHGHDAGDAVLVTIAGLLMSSFRSVDVLCRYGGEEFVVILPDATVDHARRRAEELRLAARRARHVHRGVAIGPVTLSLGIALSPDHGNEPDELLRAADQALYRAKSDGRDRTALASR